MTLEEIRQFRHDLLNMISEQSNAGLANSEAIRTLVNDFTSRLEAEAGGSARPAMHMDGMSRGKGDL